MNKMTNVLMAGVGGQGILLASEVLSEALMLAGHDVKKAEVHGMAQRGGSVVSHVRFGEKVYSPTIPEGEADILFGFELLETYRYLPLLKNSGVIIVNNLKLAPIPVATGREEYPEDISGKIRSFYPDAQIVDGLELAEKAGDIRTVNVVLLGALANRLEFTEEIWQQALENMVPQRFLELNRKAFALGQESV